MKKLCLIFLFVLIIFLFIFINISEKNPFRKTVSHTPDTGTQVDTFYALWNDGEIRGWDKTSYDTGRVVSDHCYDENSVMLCGQDYNPKEGWQCDRSFLIFNTAYIPDANTITDVHLEIRVRGVKCDTNFDVVIKKADWTEPLCSNTEANYDLALSATADDTIWRNTADISAGNYYRSGSLNTAYINKIGHTKYALISCKDRDAKRPGAIPLHEYIVLCTSQSVYKPFLEVTHKKIPQELK